MNRCVAKRARYLLLLCCLPMIGCGKAPSTPSDGAASSPRSAAKAEKPALKTVSAAKLKVADYLPALDGGRVEIAPPAGWKIMPRDRDYLTRFFKSDGSGLPRIEVKVEPSSSGEMSTATKENVERFAKLVADGVQQKGRQLIEPVIPLVIGQTPCARYVSLLKLRIAGRTITAERQTLETLAGGRLYTIDLLVLPGTLLQDRDAAYAVCAGLRFVDSQEGGQSTQSAPRL